MGSKTLTDLFTEYLELPKMADTFEKRRDLSVVDYLINNAWCDREHAFKAGADWGYAEGKEFSFSQRVEIARIQNEFDQCFGSLMKEEEKVRILTEALKILSAHPCDHKYSAECKGCNFDLICSEALAGVRE